MFLVLEATGTTTDYNTNIINEDPYYTDLTMKDNYQYVPFNPSIQNGYENEPNYLGIQNNHEHHPNNLQLQDTNKNNAKKTSTKSSACIIV